MNTLLTKLGSFIKNFDWTWRSISKAVALIIVGAIVLALVIGIIGGAFRAAFGGVGGYSSSMPMVEEMGYMARDMAQSARGFGGGVATSKMMIADESIMPPIYDGGGADAEEYEVDNYSAIYRKRNAEKTCNAITDLKALEHIVFDSSNYSERDGSCYYNFRVEEERADDVIDILKGLGPRDWNENTYTIERSVESNEFELGLLRDRLEAIQDAIKETNRAYDELIALATREKDAESLSSIINNKLNMLERLQNQARSTNEQIARLTKRAGHQTDEITYAHFDVSVQKIRIVDWRSIGDSWVQSLRDLASTVNETLQGLVIGLLAFVLVVVKVLAYVLVLLMIIKFAWVLVRKIWKWRVMG